MAFASQIHPKRLRRHQTPRKPLIFKGFPGLLCIKVERVLDPASGSQKQRSKYTDPFSRLSNQSTPVSIQLSATQFAPIDDTFSSEQILSKKESNGQTGIQKPCEIRFRESICLKTKRSQFSFLICATCIKRTVSCVRILCTMHI